MFSSFAPKSFPLSQHQNGNPYSPLATNDDQTCEFDFEDILDNNQLLTDQSSYQELIPTHFGTKEQNLVMQETTTSVSFMHPPNNFHIDDREQERVHAKFKFALRMKTKLEVIDDGYKWRKYGKKKVKSSPYPRNYFKCSTVGCNVKKRIERDIKDSSYVITTYDGVHNHI